jgi:hypothetical protein
MTAYHKNIYLAPFSNKKYFVHNKSLQHFHAVVTTASNYSDYSAAVNLRHPLPAGTEDSIHTRPQATIHEQ